MTTLIEDLHWRYATKKFDHSRKIPEAELHELLETLRLSPSSFGLQPWKFILVKDKKVREQLQKEAWNQAQVTEASEFIVFAVPTEFSEKDIKKYIHDTAATRKIPVESLKGYQEIMEGFLKSKSKEWIIDWSKKQAYLALGMLLMACAVKRIDACPMEGFNPAGFDTILGLDKVGLTSVVACPIGYRSKEDHHSSLSKVRFPKEEVIIER